LGKIEDPIRRCIDLNALQASGFCPPILRRVAAKVQETEYLTLGKFLFDLPQSDLDEFRLYSESMTESTGDFVDSFEVICLLAEILAQAEGAPVERIGRLATNLLILLRLEDMSRKGEVVFYHDRATLVGDLMDLNIAHMKQ
jgi:hypothetical protein